MPCTASLPRSWNQIRNDSVISAGSESKGCHLKSFTERLRAKSLISCSGEGGGADTTDKGQRQRTEKLCVLPEWQNFEQQRGAP